MRGFNPNLDVEMYRCSRYLGITIISEPLKGVHKISLLRQTIYYLGVYNK